MYDEIFKNVDGVVARCIIVPDGGGYFEGVKSVEEFSEERIVLQMSKRIVEVEGIDLSIGKYCDGDIQLCGKIRSVRVLLEG